MLWRKLYALRRHQAGKWVMRLRQMRMHMLEHLVGGMWPGDRQHPWMRGADNILLRPQTTRNNYLAVFRQRLTDSVITETVFLDTIPAKEGSEAARIKMLSVAPVFAEAISRIYEDKPVSPLFT